MTRSRTVEGWPAGLAQAVGGEVQRLRKARGWTGVRLSEELAAIGVEITPAAIVNLEAKRRQTVNLHEVIALAAVLGVPPIALIVPDLGAEVEMLPDRVTDAPRFALWFIGQYLAGAAHLRDSDPATYVTAADPVELLIQHLRLADDVEVAEHSIGGPAGDAFYVAALDRLLKLRRAIARRFGGVAPPMPLGLEYVETDLAPRPDTANPEENRS